MALSRLSALFVAAGLTAAGFPATAGAQGNPALMACAGIQDSAERLACYDRAVAASSPAHPAPRVGGPALPAKPAPDAAPAAVAAPTPQGLGAERLPQARQAMPGDSGITAKVVKAQERQPGRWVIAMDNGQVWATIENARLRLRPGDDVIVEPGMLGSYNLRLPEAKGYHKVTRLQ